MPLTHVINKSLKEGVFPSELKLGKGSNQFLKLVLQIKLLTIGQFLYYHFSPKCLRK